MNEDSTYLVMLITLKAVTISQCAADVYLLLDFFSWTRIAEVMVWTGINLIVFGFWKIAKYYIYGIW